MPLVSIVFLFVCWRLGLKWLTVPIILFLIFYYFIGPKLIRVRTEQFHKEALKLLTTDRATEVVRLVRRSILLQLLGPRGPLDAKLGLAYTASGDFVKAVPCLESAIPTAATEEKTALQIGLVKALFVSGELARAEVQGRTVLDKGIELPELLATVARCRVGLGKNDDMTRDFLNKAEHLSPSPDVQTMIDLTRIEMALATGRKPGQIPQEADSSQKFVRAWIHLVRGLLRDHRGDSDAANESYSHAVQISGGGFVAAVAREHQTGRESDVNQVADDTIRRDPAIRRKKRKRR
ncbi:MAG: hypothetical protein GY847_41180 [Proteobacteria bacterium]|nr:hypothetical protein [Pseudomonadota bacterium]